MAANPSTESGVTPESASGYRSAPADSYSSSGYAEDSYSDSGFQAESEYQERSERYEDGPSISGRIFRVLGGLLSVHADIAKQELGRDQSRILRGVILLVVGLSFVSMVVLLLQGVLVWLFMQRGLLLGWALLCVAGIDLLMAAGSIALSRRAFAKPVLPETRALLRRTISSLLP